jgi:hypothetical protein
MQVQVRPGNRAYQCLQVELPAMLAAVSNCHKASSNLRTQETPTQQNERAASVIAIGYDQQKD